MHLTLLSVLIEVKVLSTSSLLVCPDEVKVPVHLSHFVFILTNTCNFIANVLITIIKLSVYEVKVPVHL